MSTAPIVHNIPARVYRQEFFGPLPGPWMTVDAFTELRKMTEVEKDTLLGPKVFVVESDDDVCPICLDDIKEGDEARTIPSCKHIFHNNCISKWVEKKKTCPLCRLDMNLNSYGERRKL
ncbi:hypothetical protein AQUCO_00100150v1 [Aquilegia coerulea]|uniref:RING-type domain-containing protein n=1 Tax=Aquilegia coerulea TaxID=218851 RepID=A0A2G5F8Z2_AQUCA|nr:hypothetical protein AQUCO_00100150v1 [Aquilegia coerulea]